MNTVLYKFLVVGLFPLLTNNPSNMQPVSTGPKVKKIPSPEEETKAKLYLDSNGNYCLPSVSFRSALLSELKNQKVGKASAISVVQAAVFNVDELTVLLDPDTGEPIKEYKIDTRRAVVQRQGILRNRPRFDKWACYVYLTIDLDIINEKLIEEHLNAAGSIIGVGDYRIEKKGMFGKFKAELIKD